MKFTQRYDEEILNVKDIKVYFPLKEGIFSKIRGYIKAVDGITFSIKEGETVGLVGESGCGKSTAARAILRLVEPYDGEVIYKGNDLLKLSKTDLRKMRKEIQLIFQDPYASLNPRRTIGSIIGEPFKVHKMTTGKEKLERIVELMEDVGLDPAYINRFPHEFSGGQRQRIGIARALALRPKMVICDEPVSALDVSIQAQILNLLQKLQERYKLTYLFISHDLAVVKHISNRIAVMYLGKIVEFASKERLFNNPMHPYTQMLLKSIPHPNPDIKHNMEIIKGDIPSPLAPPEGCKFNTRCSYAVDICRIQEPEMKKVGHNHLCRCHLV